MLFRIFKIISGLLLLSFGTSVALDVLQEPAGSVRFLKSLLKSDGEIEFLISGGTSLTIPPRIAVLIFVVLPTGALLGGAGLLISAMAPKKTQRPE